MMYEHILVIEDEPELRESFSRLFELQGFKVASAPHGEEGLALLQNHKPCLILLDLNMPVMDGWQFLDELRARHAATLTSVPIVVISGAADVALAKRNYGCGYLQKPVSATELLDLAHYLCEMPGQYPLLQLAHQLDPASGG